MVMVMSLMVGHCKAVCSNHYKVPFTIFFFPLTRTIKLHGLPISATHHKHLCHIYMTLTRCQLQWGLAVHGLG